MKKDLLLLSIDEELDRLRQIRDLLAGTEHTLTQELPEKGYTSRSAPRKRKLSEDARQRIVAAQKRRWAAAKVKV